MVVILTLRDRVLRGRLIVSCIISFFIWIAVQGLTMILVGLLEEKGIHRTGALSKSEPAADSSMTDSKDASESNGKTSKLSSLKEKIKDKLHKSDKN